VCEQHLDFFALAAGLKVFGRVTQTPHDVARRSYALAKSRAAPLLYAGGDFDETDIEPATKR
jgi:uncharacterized protein with PIN domain